MAQHLARRAGLTSTTPPRWAAVALLCASVLVLSAFLAWEVPRISHITAAHTDGIETLYSLHAFSTGRDPYSDTVAAAIDRAMAGSDVPLSPGGHREHRLLYLLPPELFYLPVSWLPDETAIIVLRAITVALYFIALAALVWRFASALPAWAQGALLFAGLAWWPFLAVILPIVQQIGTVFALLVAAILLAERDEWTAVGMLSFALLLKPIVTVPFVLTLAVWAARSPAARRRYVTGLVALGVPLTALAFIVRPTWPLDWARAMLDMEAAHLSYALDPPGSLAALLHVPAALVWALVALAWGAWVVGLWRAAALAQLDRAASRFWWWMGLAAVLTLLLIPRTGTYDMVIGLIAWFVALRAATAAPAASGRVATLALVALLLGAGFLAYRDHAAVEFYVWAAGLGVALWLARRVATASGARVSLAAHGARIAEAQDGA